MLKLQVNKYNLMLRVIKINLELQKDVLAPKRGTFSRNHNMK